MRASSGHLDARVAGDLPANEVRADESGAARHNELHRRPWVAAASLSRSICENALTCRTGRPQAGLRLFAPRGATRLFADLAPLIRGARSSRRGSIRPILDAVFQPGVSLCCRRGGYPCMQGADAAEACATPRSTAASPVAFRARRTASAAR